MNGLCAGVLLALAMGSAHAQTYECRNKDGNVILQYGVPCAPGMDARNPRGEAARRQQHDREAQKVQHERDLEAAAMRRELRIGMTPEQVVRVWGNPTRYDTNEKEKATTYTWYWRCADRSRGSNAVLFKEGRVASIRTSCI